MTWWEFVTFSDIFSSTKSQRAGCAEQLIVQDSRLENITKANRAGCAGDGGDAAGHHRHHRAH